MEYLDIEEELDKLAYEGNWAGMMDISEARLAFSDLKLFRDHHGALKMCAPSVNEYAWRVVLEDCEKCSGTIKAWMHIEINRKGTRVYSDPPMVEVADNYSRGFGLMPRKGWKEQIQAVGVDPCVTKEVEDFLARRMPVDYV